jgi:transposase
MQYKEETGERAMSRYIIKGESRNQISIEPLCLDEMIGEENAVRAIEMIVESMKIKELGFLYSKTRETGRKPYSPEDMFKLYCYSYYNGIGSSRKIERECHRNIEVMWLLGELKPDHKTIANFRRDNKAAIKGAFRKFTQICGELGLISKEIVAVDGSKFRASNGRTRYHGKGKIAEKMKYYEEAAEKYMNLLEQCDYAEKENQASRYSRKELREKLEKIQKRVDELASISERVEAEGTIYLTDPDSRLMRVHNGGGDISHNVQTAAEAENHFIVAVDVTSDAVDYGQLHNMASQAKEELGVDELTAIADRGYYSGEEFAKCKEDGITVIAPKPDRGETQSKGYTKGNFRYDKENDEYICPLGEKVTLPAKRKSKSKDKRYYCKACVGCPSKALCTPKTKYRSVTRLEFDDYADEVDAFTRENHELFSKRKCLVEHPFGTVKRAFGFTYFLTRGTENVRTESLLHFLAYNMKRLFNIMETPQKLAEALRARQEKEWVTLIFSPLFSQKSQSRRFQTDFLYIA